MPNTPVRKWGIRILWITVGLYLLLWLVTATVGVWQVESHMKDALEEREWTVAREIAETPGPPEGEFDLEVISYMPFLVSAGYSETKPGGKKERYPPARYLWLFGYMRVLGLNRTDRLYGELVALEAKLLPLPGSRRKRVEAVFGEHGQTSTEALEYLKYSISDNVHILISYKDQKVQYATVTYDNIDFRNFIHRNEDATISCTAPYKDLAVAYESLKRAYEAMEYKLKKKDAPRTGGGGKNLPAGPSR
ncbi:MAG: hypothetical protein ACYTHM_14235 [Planctomycetota bacterium]|jgi:hypothetical protein